MSTSHNLTDAQLIQIVDAALADVALRSGAHLACRPGCAQCCVGAFAINALDADRLRRGLDALHTEDPLRASHLLHRVAAYRERTEGGYPGDPTTGELDGSDEGRELFEAFANDEVCPVLDPETLTCDLYQHRPMTCRVFGPPVRAEAPLEDEPAESGFGVCELCFTDASPEEIAACELVADPDNLEGALLQHLGSGRSRPSETTVVYAFSTRTHDRS